MNSVPILKLLIICISAPLGAVRKILSYVQLNMHLNQYTQIQIHTPVNIMQNTELQIFLSAMNNLHLHSHWWFEATFNSLLFSTFRRTEHSITEKKNR